MLFLLHVWITSWSNFWDKFCMRPRSCDALVRKPSKKNGVDFCSRVMKKFFSQMSSTWIRRVIYSFRNSFLSHGYLYSHSKMVIRPSDPISFLRSFSETFFVTFDGFELVLLKVSKFLFSIFEILETYGK